MSRSCRETEEYIKNLSQMIQRSNESGSHFVDTGNEGVYLNSERKHIFVEAFEDKIGTKE